MELHEKCLLLVFLLQHASDQVFTIETKKSQFSQSVETPDFIHLFSHAKVFFFFFFPLIREHVLHNELRAEGWGKRRGRGRGKENPKQGSVSQP